MTDRLFFVKYTMKQKLEHVPFNSSAFNICEDGSIIMGFTENGFAIEDLKTIFPGNKLVQLKQIHSNRIVFANQAVEGTTGDGLFLSEPGTIAVIKTADCVPLFFWNSSQSLAGILHVGWKGLMSGIELELLKIVNDQSIRLKDLNFVTGPAIESTCYEVGLDLYETFSSKNYRDEIFIPKKNGKFWLDIKKGISLSLIKKGITINQISDFPLCTYCLYPRFPSYRKNGKTGQRIFNFILLKR